MRYCFGVDVGGTTVKMGLFSTEGDILDKWEIPTRTENEGEAVLPDTAESVLQKMKEKGIASVDVEGVGIGIPAPVTAEGIVKDSANVGWKYKEVKRELEELLGGIKVRAGNDANVAALGEMWLGAGKGEKNLIMVTLGTGVGGGIVIGGQMLVGENGAGGEIGHLCVKRDEEESCGCGLRGCLEQYASATGIARLAKLRLAKNDDETILRGTNPDAKAVFDAVKAGDAVAIQIAEEFGVYLGEAMANLAVVINPAVIVIGGGVSRAGDVLLPFIEKPFQKKAFFANRETRFVLAALGSDAGICGAARLILE
ncbi:MAG: ROK family glucokinase [Dorea sp.]|jgi:glucokinase|nr:ROK family glucokinase [Dorea sp.]